MIKRLFDILISGFALILFSPILVPVLIAVWLQDFHSPFYIAPRVGRNGQSFKMAKVRSMVIHADKSGVDSTSKSDNRITAVGRFIRAYKIDELSQLLNVFIGNMSLVGPRPNVTRDVALYTQEEKKLLSVKPGITDISSIVFSDEGDILHGCPDPDLSYNQLIRPWKSRLGLLYVEKQNLLLDLRLIWLTAIAIFSRPLALKGVQKVLENLRADPQIIQVAKRQAPLVPHPPPGTHEIVTSRASA